MRNVRRLAGLLFGAAGVLGVILSVAGLVGVWVGYVEVVRRVDRVFDRADEALASVQANLGQATDRLRETEAELDDVRKREAERNTQPPAQRPDRREASRKAIEAMGFDVAAARATLAKATDAALVANGLLDALAELPAVGRVNIDTDRLTETSARLDELTERSTKLADLLTRAAPADEARIGEESSRAAQAVRRPIALAEAASDRMESAKQKLTAGHARLRQWIDGLAAALSVILVWIALGQISLAIHGGKLVLRKRSVNP